MRKIVIILLILAIGASTILNVQLLFSQSIRLDESQSIWVATKSVLEILRISGQDVQVPLYSLILHFWTQILGTDIVIARLLSLVFYLMTLPFLYWLIKEVSDRKVAILGVILFSLSPFVVWYSHEARTYTLLTLVTTINNLMFIRLVKSRGESSKISYFVASILGLYTHYFFIFLLLSQAFYLFAYFLIRIWKTKISKTRLRSLLYIFIYLGSIIFLAFLPWLVYVYKLGTAAYTQPLIPPPTTYSIVQIYLNFMVGFQNQTIQSVAISLWPLFFAIMLFIFTHKLDIRMRMVDYFVTVSFLPVILVFFLSFYRPIFLPRYLIFIIPTLFTLLAWLLINFGRELKSKLVVATILIMLLSLNFQDRSFATPVKEDYKNVVSTIQSNATPYDVVVVSAPFTSYPIEYYYSGLTRIETTPLWNRYITGPIPPYSENNLATQMNNYTKKYNRIFLVLSYDQGYQQKVVDYMDKNFKLLDKQDFASNINLRIYQLRYDPPVTLIKAR